MSNTIFTFFRNLLGPKLAVLVCAMLPVIELRGAVPLAYGLDFAWYEAFILSFIGNLLPIPIIILCLDAIMKFMRKRPKLSKIAGFIDRKAEKATKGRDNITFWGLVIFVAIPLPGTGGWTGALVAQVLNIKFVKAISAIALGIFIADVIVTALAYGVFNAIVSLF